MNKEFNPVRTPLTISADFANAATCFFGVDGVLGIIAKTYRLREKATLIMLEEGSIFTISGNLNDAMSISNKHKGAAKIDIESVIANEIKTLKSLDANKFYRKLDRPKNISTISTLLKRGVVDMAEVLSNTNITKNDFIVHGIESMAKKRKQFAESYNFAA